MLMADNSSRNSSFDAILPDDDGPDRLYFDMDSLWDMIGDTPDSSENKPEDLPVKIVPQGLPELDGSSSLGVGELPGFDACSDSYSSETSDTRTGISEGSFDSASKCVIFDSANQQSSTPNGSPMHSISGSLAGWISQKASNYSQDSLLKIPDCPNKFSFAAGDADPVSDMGRTINETEFEFRCLESSSDSKGPPYNSLVDKSDSTHGKYSDLGENSSQSLGAPHTEESSIVNAGLSSHSASHTQCSNYELPDIDFPDSESPDIMEFFDQYSIGSENTLYFGSSRQCLTENFGIQSVANNVERMVNIKDESVKLLSESTCLKGAMNFEVQDLQVERAGVDVFAALATRNSDITGMNDDHKGTDCILPRYEMSSNNADFGLMVDMASSTQIFPRTLSNMSSKKQAVRVKDEKNKELLATRGTIFRSYMDLDGVVGRKSCGVADGLTSKNRAFLIKDEKNEETFRSHGAAYQSFIDVDDVNDVAGRKSSGVADGFFADKCLRQSVSGVLTSISSKSQVFAKDEINDDLPASNRAHQSIDKDETCTFLSPAGDSHCPDIQASLQSCIQGYESIRRQLVPTMEERESNLTQSNSVGSQFSKVSLQAVQSDAWVHRSHVDDDSDICILEDLSVPACRNRFPVNVKSHIASRSSPFIDSHNHFEVGGVRLKTNDERFIFRAALQDISQPKSEATPPYGVLAVPLLKHQRIALSWMVQKETSSLHCSGGILADDQGLGKTISTIALILKERSQSSRVCTINNKQMETLNLDDDDGVIELNETKQGGVSWQVMANRSATKGRNPPMQATGRPAAGTLIVCPTSVLRQWSDELHNKVTSEANLSVLTYHGGNRTKDPLELAKYDVVLTTYAIVSMEVPKQPLVDADDDETGRHSHVPPAGHPTTKKRKYPSSSSKRSLKSKKGDSESFESVSRPLALVRWFRVVLDEAQSIKNHRTQVARACWGLRAKRRWCLSGTPIQNSIDDLYSYFRFLKYDPYAVYKSFCSTIKVPIQKNPANGYRKLQAVLKTIMLRRTKGTILDGEPIINLPPKTIELRKVDFTMEERDFYCRLEADSRAQFAEYAAAGTVKQNYVNILLMLLRLRQACDHPLLVSGSGSKSVWTSSVEMAKKLASEKQVSLLNCLEASLAICGICNDPPEDAVVTSCGHVFCNQCICEHLTGDDNQCPTTNCKAGLSVSSVFSRAALRSSLSEGQESVADCSGSVLAETLQPCSSGASFDSSKIKAVIEVLHSLSRPRYFTRTTSSLITVDGGAHCPEILCDPPSEGLPIDVHNSQSLDLDSDSNSLIPAVVEKAIVFSQWTRMLDLLESCLKDSSINYRRLDGTMSVIARDKAVKDFNTQPEVSVIIMSLKAASLGLNMVAACHVILLDLWWNPTTEDQAIDRAHRIGQTRPVSVLRLTVKDTVEDRILALQQKKREMVASAFGEDETGSRQTRLTVEDLEYLFMHN